MKVTEIRRRKVVPAVPTERHAHRLSNNDRIMPPHIALVAYYYSGPDAASKVDFDHLAESLSRVLVHYPVLAGRLRMVSDGSMEVDCNDAGALLIDAVCDGRLDKVVVYDSLSLPEDLVWKLPPPFPAHNESREGDESPEILGVKVTRFACGGVCLLVGIHHYVADGSSSCQFMNAWARIARQPFASSPSSTAALDPIPCHDRSLLRARVPPCVLSRPKGLTSSPAELVTEKGFLPAHRNTVLPLMRVWHITQKELAVLKQTAVEDWARAVQQSEARSSHHHGLQSSAEGGNDGEGEKKSNLSSSTSSSSVSSERSALPDGVPSEAVAFSTNDVLTALLWKVITRARGIYDGSSGSADKEVKLIIPTNGRKRLLPHLPEGFFGNAVFVGLISAPVSELMTESLGQTARRVRQAVNEMTNETLRSTIDWIELQPDKSRVGFSFRYILGSDVVCTNFTSFPVYQVDFGWGQPVRVARPPMRSDGHVTIMPGKKDGDRGGGLYVTFGLIPEHLRKLESDPDFMKHVDHGSPPLSALPPEYW